MSMLTQSKGIKGKNYGKFFNILSLNILFLGFFWDQGGTKRLFNSSGANFCWQFLPLKISAGQPSLRF